MRAARPAAGTRPQRDTTRPAHGVEVALAELDAEALLQLLHVGRAVDHPGAVRLLRAAAPPPRRARRGCPPRSPRAGPPASRVRPRRRTRPRRSPCASSPASPPAARRPRASRARTSPRAGGRRSAPSSRPSPHSAQQVARVQHADDVVDRLADRPARASGRRRPAPPGPPPPWRRSGSATMSVRGVMISRTQRLVEVDDAAHHLALAGLEDSLALADLDERLDLLLLVLLARLLALGRACPSAPQQQRAAARRAGRAAGGPAARNAVPRTAARAGPTAPGARARNASISSTAEQRAEREARARRLRPAGAAPSEHATARRQQRQLAQDRRRRCDASEGGSRRSSRKPGAARPRWPAGAARPASAPRPRRAPPTARTPAEQQRARRAEQRRQAAPLTSPLRGRPAAPRRRSSRSMAPPSVS